MAGAKTRLFPRNCGFNPLGLTLDYIENQPLFSKLKRIGNNLSESGFLE